jgi:alpha-N-arabinofuranosidase
MKRKSYFCLLILCLSCLALVSSCTTPQQGELIKVDTSKTGEPIEKYIYGQFIEHLGNCIYGGLWAEMLEDRKFFYPVTPDFSPWGTSSDEYWKAGEFKYLKGSPWEVMGAAESVRMDIQHPFTGTQSVTIQVPGNGSEAGIRQARLAVVADKKYTGHIVFSGSEGILPITIQLTTPSGETIAHEIDQITREYASYPIELTPEFSGDEVALEIFSTGNGSFNIGTVSLMPSDNINGWRSDVVDLLKELDSPVYRWPGGNFVSGYNWVDGIGDRDKRPTRSNPAWTGIESNDVGIHEYMELMKIIDSESFIAVNTGLGTVEEVAREIEYCNGTTDTEMGKLRAENGHPEPYGVKWWAVGNEMYGAWQLGHMPLEEYVKKHNQMADAIWDIDPLAQLIAVGAVGDWSKTMLSESADHMNLLSEHIYCQEGDPVSGHISQLADNIKRVANAHRDYLDSIPGLAEKNIRIAMDEWNYWYGDYIYGELGVRYHHKDALGVAKGLHEYFRQSDIFFMANYAQTVNVIGCIKTTPTSAGFATTGLPLKLYREQFGTIPVEIENDLPNLDISMALTSDKKQATIAVVNSSSASEILLFDFENLKTSRTGKQWLIQHEDPESYNVPGEQPNVEIVESDLAFRKNSLTIPGYAILMVRLDIK